MSFALGWAQWLVVAGSVGFIIRRFILKKPLTNQDRTGLAHLLALFVILLLMTSLSRPFWAIPGLAVIQFPWRLLLFASFCSAVVGAYFMERLQEVNPLTAMFTTLGLGVLIVLLAVPKISVQGYFPHPVEMYRPENTRKQFTNTNNEEFLPVYVNQRPQLNGVLQVSRRRIFRLDGNPVAVVAPNRVTNAVVTIHLVQDEILCYEQYYFPGWKVELDGHLIAAAPSAPSGLITFQGAVGTHSYSIYLGSSPARRVGLFASLAGCLLLLGGCFIGRRRKDRLMPPETIPE